MVSDTSHETGVSEAPSLDDRKAVTAYIMNRITSSHDNSSVSKTTSGSKSHTAYLPNFMYYQFIAADPSSIIKPTSLCSGTGISGGDQYLQPDMLNVFGMFESYFVGAGHLFQENEDSDAEEEPRRHTFYMEPIHEAESVKSEASSRHGSQASSTDSVDSSVRLEDGETNLIPADATLSIELLENIIEELKRGQVTNQHRVPEMPEYIMEGSSSTTKNEQPTLSTNKNAPGSPRKIEYYQIRDRAD